MAMRTLTIIQFIQMLLAYGAVTFVLPWILFRKKFAKLFMAERIAGYFLAGNVMVIYLVFLLEFLHISGRFTLIAGTLLPFVILIYRKRKGYSIRQYMRTGIQTVQSVLIKEVRVKMLLFRAGRRLRPKNILEKVKKGVPYIPDILLTLGLIAGILYIYGTNTFTVYGYKASDLPVHNYWINMMDDNKIFGAGVYPYGFHCMIYYLHQVFGIKTYLLFRVFALVQNIFIHLAMLVSLKMICKVRFTPYIGVGIYLFANVFNYNTFYRLTATLPQEYGMMFIFPAAAFAIRFFQEYDKSLRRDEKPDRARLYLIGFIVSFSLTLTVHFYNTMIAGVFCLGIAAGFFFRLFRWKYLKQILAAGTLSILLALLPMLVGVAMGRGLEGSLYWGMKVINGTADSSQQTSTTTFVNDEGREVTVVGEVGEDTMEKLKNGTIDEEVKKIEDTAQTNTAQPAENEQQTIFDKVKVKLQAIRGEITLYVMDENGTAANMMLLTVVLVMALGTVFFLARRADYGGMLWSVGAYMLLMCIMQSMGVLGLPELMDSSRNSIFFAYSTGVLCAVTADAILYLLFGWLNRFWMPQILSLAVIVVIMPMAQKNQLIKEPVEVTALETNGAITCLTNIIRENEDFTWTIVSANDELRMTEKFGYHYEVITLLNEMKNIEKNPEITIPTDTVYFFIEKKPVNYAQSANGMELGEVSEEYANKPLSNASGLTPYSGAERWVTMSHMYYWAERFRELYPNEMEIYYESDDFICYRLKQNDYSLYNLAIDYGYNNPKASEESTDSNGKE